MSIVSENYKNYDENMNIDQMERKRELLSRDYARVAEIRMREHGFAKPEEIPSRYHRWRTAIARQFLPHYFGGAPEWRLSLRSLGEKRTLPDFCVVGPIKGGSSDLAVSLLLHPNVMTPLAKEFPMRNPESWPLYYPRQSEKERHAKLHGMALNPYLAPFINSMELIHNLSRSVPHAKIVITLRNPAQRVYSHWKWDVLLAGAQRAASLPFLSTFPAYVDKCLSVYPEFPMFTASGAGALQTSVYWKAVSLWMEAFGRDNVMVLDIEDYFVDRNSVLSRIHKFVGLPDVAIPEAREKVNENPVRLPPPDQASLEKLRTFFAPHNRKLWDVLGKEFNW